MLKLFLKRGRDKPLLNRHPWLFSGAIARVEGPLEGDTADVFTADGNWIARASYNPHSQISARVWTFQRDEEIDRSFFRRRIERAVALRGPPVVGDATAYRLVNAESDLLPGLIVDRYSGFLVVQFLTLGAARRQAEIVSVLSELLDPRGIYERSDVDVREKEGLPPANGVLWGEQPPERIETFENGLRFLVDVRSGHKTGFYLDQRENRRRSAPFLGGEVLNAFAYTGAFGVYSARAGAAAVLNLDASAASLDLARANFALNRFEERASFETADAFARLREFRTAGRRFDSIVLDPPKFVFSAAHMERALRGYKDINLLAFQLLRPGGHLVTFSCSGLVSPDLFQKVVFGALADSGREAQIVEKLSQGPDHPILISFPESEYLKGLIIRVY